MTAPRSSAFDLTIGPALCRHLAAARRDPATSGMIPGLLFGRVNDEKSGRLMYGFYESAKAEEERFFELFEAEGIQFYIPQPQVRDMLAGKHLDLNDKGRLAAQPRTA